MRQFSRSRRTIAGAIALGTGLVLTVALVGPAVPAHAESTARYIVTTTSVGATDAKVKKLRSAKAPIGRQFRHVLHGFAASLTDDQVAQLKADPSVESVRKVTKFKASSVIQPDAPWGLDRIDQRPRAGDGKYLYESTGAGVTAYVVDTGILTNHTDFGVRATGAFDYYADQPSCNPDTDDSAHGTHVAGIIGGTTYGVAKKVNLVSVRVLDCDGGGNTESVIAGLDWVADQHPGTRSVVNLSLGGGADVDTDRAVQNLIDRGIPVVTAAGNSYDDACYYSPARVPAAITVGASDRWDEQAYWGKDLDGNDQGTNWGRCVDLFAPGDGIISDVSSSTTATAEASGTSMASPAVAGAVARYLEMNPEATPAQVSSAIVGGSSSVADLEDADGSPTKLLYTFVEGPSGAPKLTGSRSDKNKTVTASWTAPSIAGPGRVPILGYRVTLSWKNAAGHTTTTETPLPLLAGARSYVFKGLKAGTTYTLTAWPINQYGPGTPATTKQTITALPGKPKITSASTGSKKDKKITIGVKWSKPSTGGAVKNYVVTATRSGSTKTVTVSGSARSATVSGLKKNKKYTVKLRATNDSGTGSTVTWSKTVKAR